MKRIAFVTCSEKPDITPDDKRTAMQLALEHEVVAAPWDDATIQWSSFDLLVIRSCWNYHLHPEKFLAWLDQLEQCQVPVFNPLPILQWNIHKGYLRTLAEAGIPTPDTLFLRKGYTGSLADLLTEKNWNEAVVKPAISATAHQTLRVTASQAAALQPLFATLTRQSDFLVQPFIPEVQERGEWSLIFFQRQFSHAVVKKPRVGDFRVQNDFGGSVEPATPADFVVSNAAKIIEQVAGPLLYARVDGVVVGDRFLLMELELIEPMLFLETEPSAFNRFAKAIRSALSSA